jgi:hypothetical protein
VQRVSATSPNLHGWITLQVSRLYHLRSGSDPPVPLDRNFLFLLRAEEGPKRDPLSIRGGIDIVSGAWCGVVEEVAPERARVWWAGTHPQYGHEILASRCRPAIEREDSPSSSRPRWKRRFPLLAQRPTGHALRCKAGGPLLRPPGIVSDSSAALPGALKYKA